MLISLPADTLRAIVPFVAKKDIRDYLNGVHFRKDGTVEASNGHAGAKFAQATAKRDDSVIIGCAFKIPAAAVQVDIDTQSGTVTYSDKFQRAVGLEACRVIDARYPDLDRAMGVKTEAVEAIGLDVRLVDLFVKATKHLKFAGCQFKFAGTMGGVIVTHPGMPGWTAVVMPWRL